MAHDIRDAFLSELAAWIGGWNASPPVHPGRLQLQPCYKSDKDLAEFLFRTIDRMATAESDKVIAALKVRLFDAQESIGRKDTRIKFLEEKSERDERKSSDTICELSTKLSEHVELVAALKAKLERKTRKRKKPRVQL